MVAPESVDRESPPGISEEDLANVRKLRELVREQLSAYYDTDFNLLRWLHGHGNNFDEIVPKLKNHLAMRRSNFKLDTITDGPREHPVHAHWESGLTSEAGLTPNVLVNVEQTGTNDYWGILHTFSLNEILWARIYDLERMLKLVMEKERETGHQHSVLYVMDLTGLKFDRHLMTLLRGALSAISAFMSEHYVDLVHSFVVVNAPSFISMIWSIAKPLLPERTRQKVNILGASSWRREILEMVRPEALPSFWNEPEGQKVFLAELKRSTPVDPGQYHKPDQNEHSAGYTLLSISPGKSSAVELHVEKGQKLLWKFETDGHFSFGLYLVENPKKDQQEQWKLVYPRFNQIPGPTYVPLSDQLPCEEGGLYKLWFSNEHAWLHSLKIRYRIWRE